MSLPVTPPRFPNPPATYDPNYFHAVMKELVLYAQRLNAAGPITCSTINISHLPTSASGLRSGDLWNNAGVVNIVP